MTAAPTNHRRLWRIRVEINRIGLRRLVVDAKTVVGLTLSHGVRRKLERALEVRRYDDGVALWECYAECFRGRLARLSHPVT